ncbi:centromere protein V [Hyaloscypha variabilis]
MAVPRKEARPLDISILQVVEDTPETERTTHQAACHCGAVQFSVTLKWPFPKYPVNTCSCTICTQNGHLFVYPCRRDVVFTKGYDNLSSYVFHTKTKSHKFCKTCGSSILADFEVFKQGQTVDPARDILAVNVRAFKDLDLNSLEYTFFDGRKYL